MNYEQGKSMFELAKETEKRNERYRNMKGIKLVIMKEHDFEQMKKDNKELKEFLKTRSFSF